MIFFGVLFFLSNLDYEKKLTLPQAFLLTALSWLSIAVFGSLPFVFTSNEFSFTNAFFESMSGITTTGSTIISNKCIGCHTEGNPPSYLSLETYDDLILFPNLDEIINSEINPMPPIGESPLTECEKQQLTNWVNNGLPEYE